MSEIYEVVITFAGDDAEWAANSSKFRIENHPDFGYTGIEIRKVNPDAHPE